MREMTAPIDTYSACRQVAGRLSTGARRDVAKEAARASGAHAVETSVIVDDDKGAADRS